MLEFFFDEPMRLSWAMEGPFRDHVPSFARRLAEQGYARASGRTQLFVVRALGIWLDESDLSMESLSEEAIEGFLVWRREQGRLHRGHALAARRFLAHLRSRGAVPDACPVALSPLEGWRSSTGSIWRRSGALLP